MEIVSIISIDQHTAFLFAQYKYKSQLTQIVYDEIAHLQYWMQNFFVSVLAFSFHNMHIYYKVQLTFEYYIQYSLYRGTSLTQ